MNRRAILKQLGAVGGLSLFAGCSGGSGLQPAGGLVIDYQGDMEPNEQRIVSVIIGNYDQQSRLQSGTSPPEWDSDLVFQALYRVSPGQKIEPRIFVDEPGMYQFDVWVQERGTAGPSEVVISDDGTLSEKHKIVITSEGMRHVRG